MNEDNRKEEIIRSAIDAEIVLNDDLESGQIELQDYDNIPWDNAIFAGTALSSLLPAFRDIKGTVQVAMDGLYKGDALGKPGVLAQAKDGSGYLGTIINNGGLLGKCGGSQLVRLL